MVCRHSGTVARPFVKPGIVGCPVYTRGRRKVGSAVAPEKQRLRREKGRGSEPVNILAFPPPPPLSPPPPFLYTSYSSSSLSSSFFLAEKLIVIDHCWRKRRMEANSIFLHSIRRIFGLGKKLSFLFCCPPLFSWKMSEDFLIVPSLLFRPFFRRWKLQAVRWLSEGRQNRWNCSSIEQRVTMLGTGKLDFGEPPCYT